jgi:hypothetical protein
MKQSVLGLAGVLLFATSVIPGTNAWANDSLQPEGRIRLEAFNRQHPLFAMKCSATKYDKNGDLGNPYGHEFVYIKGACRDTSVPYPKLKVCDDGAVDLNDINAGVGVSLETIYTNTRFVATDGFDLFIDGNLPEDAPLDQKAFEATVQKFLEDGSARGVRITEASERAKPSDMSDEEWIARQIIGTSYALRFGRDLDCAAFAINSAQLQAGVDWTNRQNEPLVSGKQTYRWDAITDSCAHFANNVLASMGIAKAVKEGGGIGSKLGDLASLASPWRSKVVMPENNILIAVETETSEILPAERAFKNKLARDQFERFGKITGAEPLLLVRETGHFYRNDLYQFHNEPKLIDFPLLNPRAKKMDHLLSDPAFANRQGALRAAVSRIDRALREQKSLEDLSAGRSGLKNTEFKSFYARYNGALKKKRKELMTLLQLDQS